VEGARHRRHDDVLTVDQRAVAVEDDEVHEYFIGSRRGPDQSTASIAAIRSPRKFSQAQSLPTTLLDVTCGLGTLSTALHDIHIWTMRDSLICARFVLSQGRGRWRPVVAPGLPRSSPGFATT
jgi:hypothetical protein